MLMVIVALTLIKLSVIFLYRRIFQISGVFNIYSIVLSIALVAWAIGFIFGTIFQCGTRPWAYWTGAKAIIKYCGNTAARSVSFAVSDLVLDLLVLLAPIPMIWKLHISATRKVQIMGVFSLGFL